MSPRASSEYAGTADGLIAAAGALYGYIKQGARKRLRKAVSSSPEVVALVRQIRTQGYAVLPEYYGSEECARGREQIDQMIASQPDAVQSFGAGADLRIYGAERASDLADRFHGDPFFHAIGESYRRGPLVNFSTLGARLNATADNLGSGQGWHRDAFHFQFKAMVYLSDAGMDNGPFEIVPGSHRALQVARDTFVGRLDKPPASRISDAQMARLTAANPNRTRPLPGPAGTVILFDSSTIHRGMPIKSGTRYALTNYFYHPEALTPTLTRSFEPMVKAPR